MSQKIINIFRSPVTSCWDGDLDSGVENIDDYELEGIASHGYNGIWLHQPLKDYTPSGIFSEFGRKSGHYLRLLEKLSIRASKHGVRIYMYLLEPRAMSIDDPFWEKHPELRGQYFFQPGLEREYYALCSSQPMVREYLYDSLQKTCSMIDMDFFSITAAEDFSACIGKLVGEMQAREIHCCEPDGSMVKNDCPLCSRRTGAEIIAELLNTMHAGITAGNPKAELIAWDWGWRKLPWPDTEKKILDSIHKDIIYISDFEIGGERQFPRKKRIYEYSLSYVGPSETFSRLTKYADKQGRRVGAKLQIGATHELATVPNLPLMHNLWQKVDAAKKHNATVSFSTWNLGTYRTLNTWLFGHAFKLPESMSWTEFLNMACNYLSVPFEMSEKLELAWACFERAMEYLPYNVPMLYQGPINYAPAYWLPPRQIKGTPMGMSCHIQKRGDDLDYCCGDYSLDEVIQLFGNLVENWHKGLPYLEELKDRLPEVSARFMEEYNTACCIYHVYRSVLNVFRAFRLCRAWAENMEEEYRLICADELKNCRRLLPYLESDARLGMHLECKAYFFNAKSVTKKISRLAKYLAAHKTDSFDKRDKPENKNLGAVKK